MGRKSELLPEEKVLITAKMSPVVLVFGFVFYGLVIAACLKAAQLLSADDFYWRKALAAVHLLSQIDSPYMTVLEILIVALILLLALCCLIALLKMIVAFLTTYLVVTDRRVIGRHGLLKRVEMTSPLDRVDGVRTSRGLGGLIFGYAKVSLSSGHAWRSFRYIGNYRELQRVCNNAALEAQQGRKPSAPAAPAAPESPAEGQSDR